MYVNSGANASILERDDAASSHIEIPQTDPVTQCTISVVIAWVNSYDLLQAGLNSLMTGNRRPDEIIVVTRLDVGEQQKLRHSHPQVILIDASPNAPITELRSTGIRRSTGSIVVVTEDHCVPSEKWLQAAEQRISEGYHVVGGPVENAWGDRLRDWAAFLTEYSFAMLERDQKNEIDKDAPIAGNNAAYRRELIEGLCATLDDGLWESFYHGDLRRDGKLLANDPEMLLYHRRPFDFFYFIGQRYHFCRSFAEMRSQSLNGFGRVKFGVGSLILPLLLWLRGLQTLVKKKRMVGRYFLCSPLIGIYLCSGAVGEMVGYFLGGGGSLARVE
jgi:hypothetical protein